MSITRSLMAGDHLTDGADRCLFAQHLPKAVLGFSIPLFRFLDPFIPLFLPGIVDAHELDPNRSIAAILGRLLSSSMN